MEQLIGKAKEFVADKVAHVKKPDADLSDFSIKKLSRDSAVFSGQLNVSNPYSHSIPICEVSYTLKSAGRHGEDRFRSMTFSVVIVYLIQIMSA